MNCLRAPKRSRLVPKIEPPLWLWQPIAFFYKSCPARSLSSGYGLSNQKGQLVVEYILLLTIAVGLAAVITTTLASRDPEEPGFLVAQWMSIIQAIGADN